jgi:hypothetical protein
MRPVRQLTDEQLTIRFQNLAKGAHFIDGKLYTAGNVQPEFDSTNSEVKRRGLPTAIMPIIHPADPNPKLHNTALVRYAEKKWLRELIAGRISFGKASGYATLENPAQRDNEMARASHFPDQPLKIGEITYPAINIIRTDNYGSPTGLGPYYHLFSMSTEESFKLQRDFLAEGYVLIADFGFFYKAILSAVEKSLGRFLLKSKMVSYYDDLMPKKFISSDDIEFSKSIHYKYQNEARIVLIGAPEVEFYTLEVVWPDGLISDIREFR